MSGSKPGLEVQRLKKLLEGSWMSDGRPRTWQRLSGRKPVDLLDHVVTCRQAALRQRELGADAGNGNPFTVAKVAHAVRRSVMQLADGAPYREVVDVTLWCALMAELCATALCPKDSKAGQVYPKPDDMDEQWARVHRPLYLMRNAVLHPGAVLPHKKLKAEGHVSHLGALIRWSHREGETELDKQVGRLLKAHPSNIHNHVFARWALHRVNRMGDFELDRLGVEPARQ